MNLLNTLYIQGREDDGIESDTRCQFHAFLFTEKLEDVQGFCFKVYLDTQEERLAICVPHPGE